MTSAAQGFNAAIGLKLPQAQRFFLEPSALKVYFVRVGRAFAASFGFG